MMTTADMSMKMDPIYNQIARRYHDNPDEFAEAFAKAWFKLTHRDMDPRSRYLGPEVPEEEFLWQDPIPPVTYELIDEQDIAALKAKILASGLSGSQLVSPLGRQRQRSAAPTCAVERTGGVFVSRRRRIGRSTSQSSWQRCCKP
jgi:catalase (peroxidase I)